MTSALRKPFMILKRCSSGMGRPVGCDTVFRHRRKPRHEDQHDNVRGIFRGLVERLRSGCGAIRPPTGRAAGSLGRPFVGRFFSMLSSFPFVHLRPANDPTERCASISSIGTTLSRWPPCVSARPFRHQLFIQIRYEAGVRRLFSAMIASPSAQCLSDLRLFNSGSAASQASAAS